MYLIPMNCAGLLYAEINNKKGIRVNGDER